MRSGAIFGYRGLVREIIRQIRGEEFAGAKVHVVATGGYAKLLAAKLPEINAIHPNLTLEGLRIIWERNAAGRRDVVTKAGAKSAAKATSKTSAQKSPNGDGKVGAPAPRPVR